MECVQFLCHSRTKHFEWYEGRNNNIGMMQFCVHFVGALGRRFTMTCCAQTETLAVITSGQNMGICNRNFGIKITFVLCIQFVFVTKIIRICVSSTM